MLLFGEIIREAGLSTKSFPYLSQAPVTLFDRKNRIVEDSSIRYVDPFFKHNPGAKSNFEQLLKKWENMAVIGLGAKIDEYTVTVWHTETSPHIFSRTPILNPLDYMD